MKTITLFFSLLLSGSSLFAVEIYCNKAPDCLSIAKYQSEPYLVGSGYSVTAKINIFKEDKGGTKFIEFSLPCDSKNGPALYSITEDEVLGIKLALVKPGVGQCRFSDFQLEFNNKFFPFINFYHDFF